MDRKQRLATIKQIRTEIRSVFWNVWDPINMKSRGGPKDEYDFYINGIYAKLRSQSSDAEIANHLLDIVQRQMGYGEATLEHMMPTVNALREIKLLSLE